MLIEGVLPLGEGAFFGVSGDVFELEGPGAALGLESMWKGEVRRGGVVGKGGKYIRMSLSGCLDFL